MSNLIDKNKDDWKIVLRSKIISLCSGSRNKKEVEDVGYYYLHYAPVSLYKYYIDDITRLESIANNKMWYSAPVNFNDVFDCDISIAEKEIFNSLLRMTPNKREVRVGSAVWKELHSKMKQQIKILKTLFEELRSTNGISCFSESYDSLLMWGHYGENHRGMCVEYNLLEINKQLNFSPLPVIYSVERTCMRSLNLQDTEKDTQRLFIEGITSKSLECSYENEWRIIRDKGSCGDKWDDTNKGALLEMISPSSITLGCEVKSEFEQSVLDYCKKNRVNLYKMEKDTKSYKLHRKSVLPFKD